jgi:hypothetical protein
LERHSECAEIEAPAGGIGQDFAVGVEGSIERAVGVVARDGEETAAG